MIKFLLLHDGLQHHDQSSRCDVCLPTECKSFEKRMKIQIEFFFALAVRFPPIHICSCT